MRVGVQLAWGEDWEVASDVVMGNDEQGRKVKQSVGLNVAGEVDLREPRTQAINCGEEMRSGCEDETAGRLRQQGQAQA